MGNTNSMVNTMCGRISGRGTSMGNFRRIGEIKVQIGIISRIIFSLRNNLQVSPVFNMSKNEMVKAINSIVMLTGFFIPSSMPY